MKSSGCVLLLTLFLAPCLQAETWGDPRIEERDMTLTNTGPIALEIMVNKIIGQSINKFDGNIRLGWADDNYSETARQLRSALIKKGIAPERVLLTRKSGGYKNNALVGIEIRIRHIVMRLPECDYLSQNYRFNNNETHGCALNNTRNSTMVNLNDYFF
ncbi:hypothetical protein GJV11_18230 [Enterobacteriaceae bacterium RIT693]|nr:hypothetical protein [Enterobacteriaceae bacterium RIT693]